MASFIKSSQEEALELFPALEPQFRDVLASAYMTIQRIYFVFLRIEFYTSLIGILPTIFHLIILTRKPMRTSSVMSVMFGIAICDLFSMFSAIGTNSVIENMKIEDCTPPNSYRAVKLWVFLQTVRDNAVRCSTWLSVLMALFRFLMLKSVTSSKGPGRIGKFSFGFWTFGIALMISTMFSFVYSLRGQIVQVGTWKPAVDCPDQSMGSQPIYDNLVSELFQKAEIIRRTYMLLDELTSKILPCFLFPILTGFLIIQFQRTQKKRHVFHVAKRGTELTTRLIIFMTISFFFALLPTGIITCFSASYTDIGFLYLGSYVDHICYALLTINATLHCPICFAMCSQYRKTVLGVLKLSSSNSSSQQNTSTNSVVLAVRLT